MLTFNINMRDIMKLKKVEKTAVRNGVTAVSSKVHPVSNECLFSVFEQIKT